MHVLCVCLNSEYIHLVSKIKSYQKAYSVREVAFPHPSYPQVRSSLGNVYQRIYPSPLARLEMVSNVLLLLKIL